MLRQRATPTPRPDPLPGGDLAQARIRTAFQRSRHPMFLVDDRRRYVSANGPACALLDVAPETVSWHRIDDFTAPEHRDMLARQWDVLLQQQGRMEGWFRVRAADGEELQVEFSATANVLPQRHLIMLLPRLEGLADGASPMRPWTRFDPATPLHEALTDRESEVISLVAGGYLNCEIAAHLLVSPETVKSHVANALTKLGAHTRAQAVAIAVTSGEIALPAPDAGGDLRR